jgi:hypothetical protein
MAVGRGGEARRLVVSGEGKRRDRPARAGHGQDPGRGRAGIGEPGDRLAQEVDDIRS